MVNTYSDLSKEEHIKLIFKWIDYLEGGYLKAFIQKLGLNKATVSNWKSGRQGPGKDSIHLLLKAYNLTPEQYYAGPENYSKAVINAAKQGKHFSLTVELADEIEKLAADYGLSSGDELVTCLCQMFALFDDASRRAFLARWMEWRLQGLGIIPDSLREGSDPARPTRFHARLSLANPDLSDPKNSL